MWHGHTATRAHGLRSTHRKSSNSLFIFDKQQGEKRITAWNASAMRQGDALLCFAPKAKELWGTMRDDVR